MIRLRPGPAALFAASTLVWGCDPGLLTFTPAGAPPVEQRESASAPATRPLSAGTVPGDFQAILSDLVDAVNLERARVGLAPVVVRGSLCDIADSYAARLISRDFFSHADPYNGTTVAARANRAGYLFYKVGENLAAGQRDVESVMRDWMDSPTHRANILDPDFTEIGVAVRDGGRYGRYWVQEFGRPLGQ